MAILYADVIIDIALATLDKTFQYKIPDELMDKVSVGCRVRVPFGNGNSIRSGYVTGISNKAEYDEGLIKSIFGIQENEEAIEGQLIKLAAWMKDRYGSTMIQALKTVIPVKKKVKQVEKKYITLNISPEEAKKLLALYTKKNHKAKIRLLSQLIDDKEIPYDIVVHKLNISAATIKALEKDTVICINHERIYRTAVKSDYGRTEAVLLNEQQQASADTFIRDYDEDRHGTYLIHGITGSGKTEVYMEMIRHVLNQGRQVIVLIPEIALTYQTIMRFYRQFGDRVSMINSRLSAGERYDQLERAKNGDIDIMVGPRSALFTPFKNLGLIVIDEEHEGAYKSETTPRYHAREVAIKRAQMCNASVVLGSATPSVDTYYRALSGEYKLMSLTKRAKEGSILPIVDVVDMRKELLNGNRSIFSDRLRELITEKLERHEQIMLFINRRGYSGFVSCRACGQAIKCPHCDVTLTAHNYGRMVCHYCGFEQKLPKICPACGSKNIAGFGIGTEKVETLTKQEFPEASVIRMDLDTTSKKGSQEKILSDFADGKADILIGTQMIAKGHDFPNVTLVGALAADISLNSNDIFAAEKTFQLLTQAAGRAGRSSKQGNVVIQTYNPDNFSIRTAATQNYEKFYEEEASFRKLLRYPPYSHLMTVLVTSPDYNLADSIISRISTTIKSEADYAGEIEVIGPSDALISRINDVFRKNLFIKTKRVQTMTDIKNTIEEKFKDTKNIIILFDMN
ncbi:MAG: primosomal protein N' [Lachnospiraceae bacterium]|nr:primosomal protein N' [Lachnospiraceae bacterium]